METPRKLKTSTFALLHSVPFTLASGSDGIVAVAVDISVAPNGNRRSWSPDTSAIAAADEYEKVVEEEKGEEEEERELGNATTADLAT